MGFDFDVAIIGAGAAGMTAGIYCGRSGLDAVLFDARAAGGLTLTSPEVENYPGFKTISGPELMARFKEHSENWCALKEIEPVLDLGAREDGVTATTPEGSYEVGAVILTTGAEHRRLGIPGEDRFEGKGVSYCATCDGFFYKDGKVAQVGGGNTAALESLYLKGIGVDVSLIHRRNQLRAEEVYHKEMEVKGIPILWDSVVEEIRGDEKVRSLVVRNVKTGDTEEMPFDGVFIAIGMEPKNDLAKKVGADIDERGFIRVNDSMRTNVERVFAAGDVTGGTRQIITSAAEGAMAALNTLPVLGKAYPF